MLCNKKRLTEWKKRELSSIVIILFILAGIGFSACARERALDKVQEKIDETEKLKEEEEGKKSPFPHRHAGLNWSDQAPEGKSRIEAIRYCQSMGGRLPTISELRTLIQNCPATQTGGRCRVTDNCLSWSCRDACRGCPSDSSGKYSVFGDTGWFWSSSGRAGAVGGVWYVDFCDSRIDCSSRHGNGNVRCVQVKSDEEVEL